MNLSEALTKKSQGNKQWSCLALHGKLERAQMSELSGSVDFHHSKSSLQMGWEHGTSWSKDQLQPQADLTMLLQLPECSRCDRDQNLPVLFQYIDFQFVKVALNLLCRFISATSRIVSVQQQTAIIRGVPKITLGQSSLFQSLGWKFSNILFIGKRWLFLGFPCVPGANVKAKTSPWLTYRLLC